MHEAQEHREIVFTTRQRRECLERRLVLDASGIPAEAVHQGGHWYLVVDRADVTDAKGELDAYARENLQSPKQQPVRIPLYGGSGTAVSIYASVLLLVTTLTAKQTFGLDWLAAGRTEADRVVSGEWWRTLTALTLHLDAAHLLGNLVFGSVFGLLAGRVLGGGMAWLGIVIAGALGNFINALVQPPTHTSIGASTAIFAALGMIVSHALRPRGQVTNKRLKRWSPLIGGVVLLALTGTGGERTDVAAHVTGFLAGLMIGWLGARMPARWLSSGMFQQIAGMVALLVMASAWAAALTVAG